MHHPTDRIAHTTAFVTPVVEHWLEREIAQLVHPMKDRSDDHAYALRWHCTKSSDCQCLRSECNEGCDWCIYVTVVTCADTLTSTLCIQ